MNDKYHRLKIKSHEAYNALYLNNAKREEAFRIACDLRKFELDLYWRRAAYFWAFTAIVFAGYFTVLTSEHLAQELRDRYLLLIATLGFLLSFGWFLAIRGSKYWSSNWELHVNYLEQSGVGPLFTTTIDRECLSWYKPFKAYPHSVGKINQAMAFLLVIVWICLVAHATCHSMRIDHINLDPYLWVIPVAGVIYALIIWFWAATDFGSREPDRQWFVARQFKERK